MLSIVVWFLAIGGIALLTAGVVKLAIVAWRTWACRQLTLWLSTPNSAAFASTLEQMDKCRDQHAADLDRVLDEMDLTF